MSKENSDLAALATVIIGTRHNDVGIFAARLYDAGVRVLRGVDTTVARLAYKRDWAAVAAERTTLLEVVGALTQLGQAAWADKRDKDASLLRDLIQLFENREKVAAIALDKYIEGDIPEPE